MKYLKQYESFQSSSISSVLNYVKSKVSKGNYNQFVGALRRLMINSNIPIDKLTDEHVKYMSAKKALDIKNMNFSNDSGIWSIKYWFSLKDGYIGCTGTGKKLDNIDDSQLFYKDELDYIKQNITKTGLIRKVTDLNDLKTGDTILAYFSSTKSKETLSLAKVFIDDYRCYAIQNISSGSTSSNEDWENYTQFGELSWHISDNMNRSDTKCLHLFTPSDKELQYSDDMGNDSSSWNLPFDSNLNLRNWNDYTWNLISDIDDKRSLYQADFAVVVYYDSILKTNFEPVIDTKLKRKEGRKGATKLMDDKSIRSQNIERYFKKIADKLNLSEDCDFYDLQKLISRHLASQYTMISLITDKLNIYLIDDYTSWLYSAIEYKNDKEDVIYYIDKIKNYYLIKSIDRQELMRNYNGNENLIKNENLRKTFDEILKIGDRISNYFNSLKIDDIDDLFIAYSKLKGISDIFSSDKTSLSAPTKRIINNFHYKQSVEAIGNSEYHESQQNSDMTSIRIINKYLDSILT